MGSFVWNGKQYEGTHEPLVARETCERVQSVLSGHAPRRKPPRRRHRLAFSGLICCGLCHEEGRTFRLVGELKKGRYIYYRCEECKRRHRAIYVREEAIVDAFVTAWGRPNPTNTPSGAWPRH